MEEFLKTKSNVAIVILIVIIIALSTIVVMQECRMRRFDTRGMRDKVPFSTQMQKDANYNIQNRQ